ncbi:MAG: hypothetical protein IME99_08470 [Proteobacteria bacterium]|nr:hypothetical protein [Pseudomonadota bacterium]
MTPTTQNSTDLEFVTIGTFEPRITLPLVEELNRRKIIHRVKEVSHFSSTLVALIHSATAAGEVLAETKKKHPRVRL